MIPLWEKQLLLLRNEFKAEAKSGYFKAIRINRCVLIPDLEARRVAEAGM